MTMEPTLIYTTANQGLAESTSAFTKAQQKCAGCDLVAYNYVVDYSFLLLMKHWEWFLEKIFIAYLQGKTSLKGSCLVEHPARNEQHAVDILTGASSRYVDWSDIDVVLKILRTHYDPEKTEIIYTTIENVKSHFAEMKIVRNAIAHNSDKATRQYNELIRNKSSRLIGSPTSVFLSSRTKAGISYYQTYLGYINFAIRTIAEYEDG